MTELYEILALRQVVFAVEQNSVYLDTDGVDYASHHVMGYSGSSDPTGPKKLVAYLRIVPPEVKYGEASIGRVVNSKEVRGTGIGRILMQEGLKHFEKIYGNQPIRISAQAYLEKFYSSLGFKRESSEPYMEDGIPHIEMLKP